MKALISLIAALTLGGCGTLSAIAGGTAQSDNAEVLRALGDHLEGCDRHYQGGLGLGASFTFTIDCKAMREAGEDPLP